MEKDFSTLELINSRPILRSDLLFKTQRFDEEMTYIIEDPIRSKFFRIGLPEYQFMQYLNGYRTVGDALNLTAGELGKHAISEREAATIVHFLFENELIAASSGTKLDILSERRQKQSDVGILKKLNLLFLKMPLFNPDRLLDFCMPLLKFLLGKGFFCFWVLALLSAVIILISDGGQFNQQVSHIFSLSNWHWLLIAWITLKCIHELFHGLVCKYYGGKVYEAGVIWILFAPIGYVDATSSWMFNSKWQRMHTAAAGMYIELFIAAIATWIWAFSEFGPLKELAFNIVILASITTILFNANPLMKFDGYYIFSDFVEIPNLYGEGNTYVKHLAKKYLLTQHSEFPVRSKKQAVIIKTYGIAAFIWRILIMATIFIIASNLFHGLGLLIVFISILMMFGRPLLGLFTYLKEQYFLDKRQVISSLARFVLLLSTVVVLLTQLTFKQDIQAVAVVDYSNQYEIFTDVSGFIEEIYVESGENIDIGQTILKIENLDLTAEYASLEFQLRKLSIERKTLLIDRQITQLQALDEKIQAISSQLTAKKTELDGLLIKAKQSGKVFLTQHESVIGQYVRKSTKLGSVASAGKNQIYSLFHNRYFDHLKDKQGNNVNVFIGMESVVGTIRRVSPNATQSIEYPELTTIGGGNIAVFSKPGNSSNQQQLLNAHFQVDIDLIAESSLKPGQTGTLEIRGNTTSIASFWYNKVTIWVNNLVAQV